MQLNNATISRGSAVYPQYTHVTDRQMADRLNRGNR